SDTSASASKKHRKSFTLEEKLEVIKRIEKGERNCDISRTLNMHESSVRTIRAQAEKIKESCKNATPVSVKKVVRTRSNLMENMERLLSMWIEDQTQRKMPMSLAVIQEKAKALYDAVKIELNETDAKPFNASHGWFERFKKRSNLHNIKITGGAAAADMEAAESFPAIFEAIIKEGGYSSKQVFNLDKTGLFWKRMPARTYLSHDEAYAPSFKAAKDHITVMLCTNANGDCKLKLIVVHCSANPRALASYSKDHLPGFWRSNVTVWVTVSIFTDYLCNRLTAELKDYCLQEDLAFKILLLLDNAPGHPPCLTDLSENIRVLFLPPNTTPLIQPLDQGVIAAFKAYYLRRMFARLIRETDGENKPTIKEFWRKFNIKDAIDIIAEAWAEVSSSCLNAVWRRIWPACVHEFREFDTEIAEAKKQIVALAHEAGLEEVDANDVQELLHSHGEELSIEELKLLDEQRLENEPEYTEPVIRTLSMKVMAEAFKLISDAINIFDENDPDRERSSKVAKSLESAISCYQQLYNEKQKQ
uniref:HTH CENPB-type domain-containing protein n=1 Tax=Pelodiscus sinensis TaxID=13735 RepID=K7EX90_PELSI